MIDLKYSKYKVYIINDGSKDKTIDVLDSFLNLTPTAINEDSRLTYERIISKNVSIRYPNIFVINKENGGKADALNAGISCCSEEIIITLDADCMLKKNAVSIMNKVFQNRSVVAAGGTVHITQSINKSGVDSKLVFKIKKIIKFQVLQYLIAFYLHKFTQSIFNALIVISGAYGAFKRDLLIKLNGYRKTVGEDMDITLKVHRFIKMNNNKYSMVYVSDSVCFTECPERFRSLVKQRIRWQKAFMDCLIIYGLKMFRQFNAGISLFFIFDGLILGNLTSIIMFLVPLFIIMGNPITVIFIVFISTDFVLGIVEGVASIMRAARHKFCFSKSDYIRIGIFIPFQLLSYRFLNILFVIAGTCCYFINKNQWNKVDRLGRQFFDN